MSSIRFTLPVSLLAFGVAFAVADDAYADITVQASAGTSFLVSSADDVSSSRGPVTFDIGPGWDLGLVRLEVPMIFALDEPDVYPRARSTFLGFRPQAKVYPFDWLYGKLSTPILFPGADDEPSVVLALAVGGGVEFEVVDMLLIHGEVNFSPHIAPADAIPVEGRIGATFKF